MVRGREREGENMEYSKAEKDDVKKGIKNGQGPKSEDGYMV